MKTKFIVIAHQRLKKQIEKQKQFAEFEKWFNIGLQMKIPPIIKAPHMMRAQRGCIIKFVRY